MYKIAFKHGFIIFDTENQVMIFSSNKAVKDMQPLDLKVDKFIININTWYFTTVNILRGIYRYKAEYRIPQEDFHMSLEPFGVEGEAILKVMHETKKQGYIFKVKRENLYVLKSIFEEIDKLIDINGFIFQKSKDKTTIEDIVIPYQVKKSLKFLIEEKLNGKKIKPYFFSWDFGRVEFTNRRFRLFEGIDGKYYLKAELKNTPQELINMLMVL